MASIRKVKKELKRKFKKALPTMALSPKLESFTIVGPYKGYRWRLHIPTNPRKKITASIKNVPIPNEQNSPKKGQVRILGSIHREYKDDGEHTKD